MSADRQPKGIPVGGQFAATAHSEPDVALTAPAGGLSIRDSPVHEIAWDTPEDQDRFREAADFLAQSDVEGVIAPLYTQYRPDDGTDGLILQVDGRNMTVHHAGSMSPSVAYGDDENDAWNFRMEAGDGAGKTEHEVLADVVQRARHDAACQEAWRGNGETFQEGDEYSVRDFGVRYIGDERIVTLSLDWDRRGCELIQRGNGDVQVHYDGADAPVSLPHIQLDAIAWDFDKDHIEGTGDIRFKAMMQEAAERAAKDPGYSPRRL
jgi:hypothetical protein